MSITCATRLISAKFDANNKSHTYDITYARLVGCDFHVTKHCLENGPAKFGSTDQQIHSLHIRDEIRRDVPAWAINHSSAEWFLLANPLSSILLRGFFRWLSGQSLGASCTFVVCDDMWWHVMTIYQIDQWSYPLNWSLYIYYICILYIYIYIFYNSKIWYLAQCAHVVVDIYIYIYIYMFRFSIYTVW